MEIKYKILLACVFVAIFVLVEEFFTLHDYVSAIQPTKLEKRDIERSEEQAILNFITHAYNRPITNKHNSRTTLRNMVTSASQEPKWQHIKNVKMPKLKIDRQMSKGLNPPHLERT